MRQSAFLAGLFASALLVATSSPAKAADQPSSGQSNDALSQIIAQLQAMKQQPQGKYTVNQGSLAVESWLLTSHAVDATADTIGGAVARHLLVPASTTGAPATRRAVLILAGTEALDFGKVAMMEMQVEALADRLNHLCHCQARASMVEAAPALVGAIAGLLKSETELTGVDQTVDPKLLAAAVAQRLNGVLPSAAIGAGRPDMNHGLIKSFNDLTSLADAARNVRDELAKIKEPTAAQKETLEQLTALLTRFDAFYAKVTTADGNGVVPLGEAIRLQELMANDPLVLRVNTEKAGGTLVKRTNMWTALGAESVFITGGLVSSYQLTDPKSGSLLAAGVVTCRTTLTTLKKVQDASWTSSEGRRRKTAMPVCTPGNG